MNIIFQTTAVLLPSQYTRKGSQDQQIPPNVVFFPLINYYFVFECIDPHEKRMDNDLFQSPL